MAEEHKESVPYVEYEHNNAYYRFYIGGKMVSRDKRSGKVMPLHFADLPQHLINIPEQLLATKYQIPEFKKPGVYRMNYARKESLEYAPPRAYVRK